MKFWIGVPFRFLFALLFSVLGLPFYFMFEIIILLILPSDWTPREDFETFMSMWRDVFQTGNE
jgi:hypothetical protein